MNAPSMFMPVGQDRVVAKLAAAILEDGASASIVAPEGAGKTAVLDHLASELAGGQARIVRVACPHVGGLSLPAFLSQVIGRTQGVLSNEDLELASDLLTQADTSCSPIALLVDDAHDLLPPALRYVQFACMSGPLLRVVLAGRPGTLELLRGDEFGYLRQRISRNIQLPPLSATTADSPTLLDDAPVARAPVAAPPPARRRNGPAWALAGLGIAASVAVAAYLDRQDAPPAPMAASVAPESVPALDRSAAPVDMPPSVALAEAPPAVDEPAMQEATAAAPPIEEPPPILTDAEPAPDPVTPREAAGLLPQPSPDVGTAFVEAAQPAPEHAAAEVVPEQEVTVAEPIPADVAATPREMAVLQSQPSLEPPITAVELPVAPPASEPAATDMLPEPPTAGAAVTAAPLDPAPAMVDAAPGAEPSQPEPVVADAEPPQEPTAADAAAEPPAAVAELPAAPFAPEPPAIVAGPVEPPAQEPAIADVAPAPSQPEASSAPVMGSLHEPSAPLSGTPGTQEAESAVADLPVPPVPVPAPALPVVATPEAPRRAITRPARVGPERVAAYDARADERRCRDIVLRAQLGEDITNADRQFLRAGCRAGR